MTDVWLLYWPTIHMLIVAALLLIDCMFNTATHTVSGFRYTLTQNEKVTLFVMGFTTPELNNTCTSQCR